MSNVILDNQDRLGEENKEVGLPMNVEGVQLELKVGFSYPVDVNQENNEAAVAASGILAESLKIIKNGDRRDFLRMERRRRLCFRRDGVAITWLRDHTGQNIAHALNQLVTSETRRESSGFSPQWLSDFDLRLGN